MAIIQFLISSVQNFRAAMVGGLILWFLIVATLQIAHVIDLQVDCPWCLDLFKGVIGQALASEGPKLPAPHSLPIPVHLTILPGWR